MSIIPLLLHHLALEYRVISNDCYRLEELYQTVPVTNVLSDPFLHQYSAGFAVKPEARPIAGPLAGYVGLSGQYCGPGRPGR